MTAPWDKLTNGDPLTTVRIDPATESIGIRLLIDGVRKWRITKVGGEVMFDESPTLDGWHLLASPTA